MFAFEEYRDAIVAESNRRRIRLEAEVLNFERDATEGDLYLFTVRFLGKCDASLFEDGTVCQDGGDAAFRGDIVEIDAALGTVTVKAVGALTPVAGALLVLEPADYLKKLREFAEKNAELHEAEREARFADLRTSLLRGPGAAQPGGGGQETISVPPPYLRTAQHLALQRAAAARFSFVWGPPGTGKSYTLGHIAAHFRAQGKKVLLLSNTNAAVDVATFAVDDACRRVGDPLRKGDLIRYARVLARAEGYKDRPHLLEFTRLLQRYAARERELLKKCEELEARLARCAAEAPDVPQIQFDLAAVILERKGLGERRRTEVAELLGQARIVAATLTSAMYNGFAESGAFDVVLVDEASVMPLAVWPYLLHHFGAGRHLPQFVVAGDPMQLTPIGGQEIEPRFARWFENNIYSHLGMDGMTGIQPFLDAGTVTLLDEQTRMRREICRVVSERFYGGRLVGDRTDETRPWPASSGIPNGEIVLLDPGGRESYVTRRRFGAGGGALKNTNTTSALLVERILRRMLVEASPLGAPLEVLVISPFTNQVRHVYERRLKALEHLGNVRIEVATVHRSQGSEADVVFFDVVDPSSWFVNTAAAAHLWCVACSRARRQLFVVGEAHALRAGKYSGPMFKDEKFLPSV